MDHPRLLIMDTQMSNALCVAAQSGVDVRIITPNFPDKWYVHPVTRSNYLPLLSAGVRIFEYTPGFMHAKMFVSDDEVSIVGTTNMDYRSFYMHFECGVAFFRSSVATLRNDILRTLDCARRSLSSKRSRDSAVRSQERAETVHSPDVRDGADPVRT